MYMSYCRQEGTLAELRSCLEDATERINGFAEYEMSDSEVESFRTMVETFVDWLHDMDFLDCDGSLDYSALYEACERMKAVNCEEE